VRRNSIIKSHEGPWRKIMNKRDRNEDVSKSRVHSDPSPIPKQKEACRDNISTELQISFCPLPEPCCLFTCLSSLPPQKGKEDLNILSGYITVLHDCYSFGFIFSPGDICILLVVVCRLLNESRHSRFGWNGSFQTSSSEGSACKRKRQEEQ
jgi:hypothetical protein